jgi:membrane protein
MSFIERVDALQQRHPALGFPLAVIYKYTDDQGGYLAALVAYYAFLSLFPLLLLLSTVLGFVLTSHPDLQRQVLDSALGQFPVIGQDLKRPGAIGGGTAGIVVGVLGSLYGGLGVAQALQNALNVSWAVPRNQRPNPFKARAMSLRLLGTVGLAILATTALTAIANGAGGLAHGLGALFTIGVLVAGVLLNAFFFGIAFRIGTARELSAALRGRLAGAAELRRELRAPRRELDERDRRHFCRRPRPARLPVHRLRHDRALGRAERRARQAALPARAADPVHRRGRPDPR